MTSSGMLRCAVFALIMKVVGTFEMTVNFYRTIRRNMPEDNHLHTRRRDNLKSQKVFCLTFVVQ
jgi:hypothetical protein